MTQRRPTIGVVAISYNEERDMPGFLANLLPWVDEIVIVDDESTDRTRDIALEMGDKVKLVTHKKTDEAGFAGQRNVGIEAASTDWLLNMDIDERVSPALAREMKKAIENTALNGFRYHRLNYFMHRPMLGGGWQTWNNPQLARRGKHCYENVLHERCVIEGEPRSVGQLHEKIWHLNDEGYLERMEKSFRYCQIEAEALVKLGRRISVWAIVVRPLIEFLKKYVGRHGYRDGIPGLISALHSAGAIFRANVLAWDEQNRIPREDLEKNLSEKWHQDGGAS
ncbi:glycosyltransferase family 2 protein [Akkermansiaceae bacterium]|nr:glycosyltransferase family 2 protein [Akkermansiaceae bacterium]